MTFDVKTFLANLSTKPGVYQMFDTSNTVLYVGKAKNLKKRVSSYFNASASQSLKTKTLVEQIANIEVTVTHTETEALILENNFIKQHQPRYNILLRDDKSYPYIFLSNHPFPRLGYHRGAKKSKGRYFGPYPHVSAVRESLELLNKLFPIRQCKDVEFRHRSRPCLQYQIKRCTAPCVGLIDEQTYRQDVEHAVLFLQGKSQQVVEQLMAKMEQAAQNLNFEQAAKYRDQIAALRSIQEQQYMTTEGGDVDIVACISEQNIGCVQLLSVRDGRHIGSQAFFPKHTQGMDEIAILSAFLPQYYLATHRDIPDEMVLSHMPNDTNTLISAIKEQCQKQVKLSTNVRTTRAKWLDMAVENAKQSLLQRKPSQYRERLANLCHVLRLETMPQRMECFDISHSQGEATTASCVVFDQEGAAHSAYRRFNIEGVPKADDYAAMQQALTRRFAKLKPDSILPDILFIDGGKGQVKIAYQVLEKLDLHHKIKIIGVSKGMDRKAGLEKLVFPDINAPLVLPKDSPALHLILHIRDESHRFALIGHQGRRAKVKTTSVLEQIEGVGAKRRKALIKHFGGLQGVSRAGVDELAKVQGISRSLAQRIYDYLNSH
ncbi:excinuclease ABC subunit UvrC [Candidatus Albibeggiatoa sp. nov. NOAA]|uniref:excinuclease ABC subunit UvrC n=1 Tax=Candidatus Albibeggiatoa sp. nov. NOAA TaxID=3162724 RepID=UPI0032FF931A|nr:excinuclease ABC subunit UvrC [Thiotrichaceae bacterium]